MKIKIAFILGLFLPVFGYSQTYCAAGVTFTNSNPQIQNVTLAGINNSTAVNPCLAYTYFSALSGSMIVGSNYVGTVNTRNACSGTQNKRLAVYIDWNKDGDFADAGESVFLSANFTANNTVSNLNITVPGTATVGTTRMRVVLQEATSVPPSCGTINYGEFEDYPINVICTATSGVSVTRQFDDCNDQAETFTASGMAGGVTINWETSIDGTTWNPAIAGPTYSSPAVTQNTFIRAKATDANCSGLVGQVLQKVYFNVTATPSSICPGSTSQLNAPKVPTVFDYVNTASYAVPDNNPAGGTSPNNVTNYIPISVGNGTINKVCFSLTHTFTDDVTVSLIGPDGTSLLLVNKKSGSNFTNTCFAPGATTAVPTGNNKTGTYIPDGGDLFTAFANKPTNGTWSLFAVDNVNGSAGTITKFQVTFNQGTINWSPAGSLSNATLRNPIASPTSTQLYTATYTGAGSTCNIIDTISVIVKPTVIPTVSGTNTICEGGSTTLTAASTTTGVTFKWFDAATAGTQLSPNATLTVTPATTTTYYAEATLNGCAGTRTAYTVTVVPTPVTPTGTTPVEVCSGQQPLLTAATTTTGATLDWYTANTGGTKLGSGSPFSPPAITANTTYYVEAIKSGCPSPRFAINVTVNALPAAPTVANQSICSETSATLAATDPAGVTFNWYNALTGGPSLANTNSYTTVNLINTTPPNAQANTTKNYYVTSTDGKGCVSSPRTQVKVTIKPLPILPTVTTPAYTCEGTSITLTSTKQNTSDQIDWWSAPTGGTSIVTNTDYTTPVLNANATYFVSSFRNGCYSKTRAQQDVEIVIRPVVADITDKAICSGLTFNQPVTTNPSANTTLSWTSVLDPAVSFGGSSTGTGSSPATSTTISDELVNTSTPGIITYTITSSTDAGGGKPACAGNTVSFKVTVNPLPAAVTASDVQICHNSTATLTATAPGNDYFWYAAPTGGTALNGTPSATYTSPVLTAPTATTVYDYFVDNTDANSCVSLPRTNVKVTVYPIPVAPTVANVMVCTDSTATFNVTSSGDQFDWYSVSTGGTAITSGPSFTSPTLSTTTNYYVSTTTNNCTGPRKMVTATTIATPILNPITSNTICSNVDINKTLSGSHATVVKYIWTSVVSNGAASGNTSQTTPGATPKINNILKNNSGAGADVTYTVQAISTTTPACPSLPQSFTITVNPEFDVTATQTNVICYGLSTGEIIADGSAAKQPETYLWKKGAVTLGTTTTISGQPAGTYNLTVTDKDGCVVPKVYTITQPANDITITGALTQVACNGNATGAIQTTVNNTVGTVSYSWSNSATTADISNLPKGPYTVTVTDGNSCVKSANFTITEPAAPLSYTFNKSDVLCYGNNTGNITLNVSGGTIITPGNPYTYLWNTGATTKSISNLIAGNYLVTVTDKNGCKLQDLSFTIMQPTDTMAISKVITDVNCFGDATGAIDVTSTGGTAPYSFAWSNGATTEDISNLIAGTYNLTVTDKNNCKFVQSTAITQKAVVAGTLVKKNFNGFNVSCNGLSDGEIDLTPTGGTSPYTFVWSTGATTEDITGLDAKSYSVIITDDNGCTGTLNSTITQPTITSGTSNAKTYVGGLEISCFGSTDGEIDFIPAGGVAPYTLTFNGSPSSYPVNNLGKGTYTLAFTDANGCPYSETKTLNEPADITVLPAISSYNGFQISCNGLNDGSIKLNLSGGTSPYNYLWNTTATTDLISNLTAGFYQVDITDANGCAKNRAYTLNQPTAISIPLNPVVYNGGVNITCNGLSNGSINNPTSGGVSPYSYVWTTGATSQNLTGLPKGTYGVTVTDKNGCVNTQSVTLIEPAALAGSHTTSSYNGFEIKCFGDNNGSAVFTISGGSGPYSYSWNSGQNGSSINNVPAGSYNVSTTDANGCKLVYPITLNEPAKLVANQTVSNFNGFGVSCFGSINGSISLTIQGGVPTYTTNWNMGLPGNTSHSNLAAGTYSYAIIDANNCAVGGNITITEPNALGLTATQTAQILCFGQSTGALRSTITGGVSPFNYVWKNAALTTVSNNPTATGLPAGTYSLAVTDANNCNINLVSQSISEPTKLLSTATGIDPKCFGKLDGSVSSNATGGTPGYTYKWINGPATSSWNNIGAGIKTIVVTDFNGCKDTTKITLNQPTQLVINTLSSQLISCDNKPAGSIQVQPGGGTLPYTLLWSNGNATGILTGLTPGTYSVNLLDGNNCAVSNSFTVNNVVTPDPFFTVTDPVCGDLMAVITATQATGFDKFTFITNPGSLTTFNNLTYNLTSPTYGYTVIKREMNNQGCKAAWIDTVAFKDIPVASFSYDMNQEIDVLNNEIKFSNTSINSNITAVTNQWTIDGIPSVSVSSPVLKLPNDAGALHVVCLEVINAFGCTDKVCESVEVKSKSLVYIPNTFTPDFDGINDEFAIDAQGIKPEGFNINIYNRMGLVVYTSSNPNFKWDGTVSGVTMPQGIYIYDVKFRTLDTDELQSKSGTVTIIR